MEIGSMAKQPSAVYQLPVLKRYIIFTFLLLRIDICTCILDGSVAVWRSRAGQKLEVFNCNSMLASFGPVLCCPCIERQSAFDEYQPALGQVLVYILGLPTKRPTVDKAGFFPLTAVLARPPAIHRHSKINYRRLVRCIRQLGITGQITHYQNFVKISHL